VSDCPNLHRLRRLESGLAGRDDGDHLIAAHVASCPDCAALVELSALSAPEPEPPPEPEPDADDCARAELLLWSSATTAPNEDDARFFRRHLRGCAACREIALDPPAGIAVPLPSVSPDLFVLGAEIGRGGMGRILAAHDRRIGRAVAIKEMLTADPLAMVRFEWEARITARLQHPSIVSIYEVGRWPDGRPFYAMPILPGRTLGEAIAGSQRMSERLALIPTVIAAADAAAYAHSRRIIHRDLTPSNILIGPYGETVVIDWGLAKDLDDPTTLLTGLGSVVGTPAYSAPEQRQAHRAGEVDERTDVYALGAILSEVLTGDGAPQELLSVAAKAMHHDMAKRYSSAQDFARELRRQQQGQPVEAHFYSRRERAARWLSRRLALVLTSSFLLTLVAASAIIGGVRVMREQQRALRTSSALLQEQGRQELLSGRPARAFAYLSEAYRLGNRSPAARFLLAAASRSVQARAVTIDWPAGQTSPSDMAFDPSGASGDRLVVAHGDQIGLWDARTGQRLGTIEGADFTRVAFAGTGTKLLAWGAGSDADPNVPVRARLLDIDDRSAIRVFGPPEGRVNDARLSQDEATLLIEGDAGAGAFSLWNTRTAQLRFPLGGAGQPRITFARLTRGGRQVITLDLAGKLAIRDVDQGAVLAAWPSHTTGVHGFEVSSDASRAVISEAAAGTRLWDLVKGSPLEQLGPARAQIAFSPDGAHVLTIDANREAQLFAANTGTRTARLGLVSTFAFAPDSGRLATADTDGTFKVWLTDTGTLLDAYEGTHVPTLLAFSRDGRRLATAATVPPIEIWDLEKSALARIVASPAAARLAGFVAGTGDVVTTDRDGNVGVWPVTGGPRRAFPHPPTGRTLDINADRTGLLQRSWLNDRELQLHDLRTGSESLAVLTPSAVQNARLSRDGTRLVAARAGERVRLWDVPGRREIPLSDGIQTGPSASLAFSADGQRLFTHDGRQSDLWDPRDGRHVATIEAGSWPTVRAFFSPDGSALATTGGRSQIWSGSDGRFRFSVETGARAVTFSRDSRYLALLFGSARGAAEVAIVDARDGQILASLDEPDVSDAAFAADSAIVATIGRHASSVWDWRARRLLARFAGEEPSPDQLVSAGTASGEAFAGFTTLARFDDPGLFLAVSRRDRGVLLWDVHLESRDPAEITSVGHRSGMPWRLQAGQLEFSPVARTLADRGINPAPSNLDFETGAAGGPPDPWTMAGARHRAVLTDERPAQGRLCVRLERAGGDSGQDGHLQQRIDAQAFRGRKLRVRASVRTEGDLAAALWVGVERKNGRTSQWSSWWDLFDHPIASPEWKSYDSVGHVDDDAESLQIGIVVKGTGRAWVDDVKLEMLPR
jgi:WD40 repeat protein